MFGTETSLGQGLWKMTFLLDVLDPLGSMAKIETGFVRLVMRILRFGSLRYVCLILFLGSVL